jgi:hypothetical protein
MKRILLIAGIIMAVMMVVQPCYAKTFNIVVTIGEFSMDLMTFDNQNPYENWTFTVPPGGAITMTAKHSVMISLSEHDQNIKIFASAENTNMWTPVEPGQPIGTDQYELIADCVSTQPPDDDMPLAMADPTSVTNDSAEPVCIIPQNENNAWLIFSFRAGTDYSQTDETFGMRVEAVPE